MTLNNIYLIILVFGFLVQTPIVFAAPGNGVVIGDEAANARNAQIEATKKLLKDPGSLGIALNQNRMTAEQLAAIQARLQSEVKKILEQLQSSTTQETGAILAQWAAQTQESSAIENIQALVQSSNLTVHSLEVVKAFLKLGYTSLVKPSMVLEAINSWPVAGQRGLALALLRAVHHKKQSAIQMSSDDALRNILGKKINEYLSACGR